MSILAVFVFVMCSSIIQANAGEWGSSKVSKYKIAGSGINVSGKSIVSGGNAKELLSSEKIVTCFVVVNDILDGEIELSEMSCTCLPLLRTYCNRTEDESCPHILDIYRKNLRCQIEALEDAMSSGEFPSP